MSFFSKSSGKKHYGDKHHGSNYYKREGFLSRILKMFGSFSSSDRRYNKHHSHFSHDFHHNHYSNHGHRRRKYKSSWSWYQFFEKICICQVVLLADIRL